MTEQEIDDTGREVEQKIYNLLKGEQVHVWIAAHALAANLAYSLAYMARHQPEESDAFAEGVFKFLNACIASYADASIGDDNVLPFKR